MKKNISCKMKKKSGKITNLDLENYKFDLENYKLDLGN